MTCDFDCDNCEDETLECPPLSSAPDISKAIDRAVSMLTAMDKQIDSEADLANVTMVVNAEWLANVCSALLEYASDVDGVDVEEMFEFESMAIGSAQLGNPLTKH